MRIYLFSVFLIIVLLLSSCSQSGKTTPGVPSAKETITQDSITGNNNGYKPSQPSFPPNSILVQCRILAVEQRTNLPDSKLKIKITNIEDRGAATPLVASGDSLAVRLASNNHKFWKQYEPGDSTSIRAVLQFTPSITMGENQGNREQGTWTILDINPASN